MAENEKKKAKGGAENKNNNESKDKPVTTDEKKRKQRRIILIIIVAVLLAVIGILIYLLLTREPETQIVVRDPLVPRGGRGMVLTPDNMDGIPEDFSGPIEDGQYTVSMSTDWVFETAKTPSANAIVNNLARNSRTVCFDVYIRDTWEVIYCSPYMPLGTTNANFALDKDIPAGTYDCVVVYFLVDDDLEVITDLSVSVNITVLR